MLKKLYIGALAVILIATKAIVSNVDCNCDASIRSRMGTPACGLEWANMPTEKLAQLESKVKARGGKGGCHKTLS